jgi:hypothetical protein
MVPQNTSSVKYRTTVALDLDIYNHRLHAYRGLTGRQPTGEGESALAAAVLAALLLSVPWRLVTPVMSCSCHFSCHSCHTTDLARLTIQHYRSKHRRPYPA